MFLKFQSVKSRLSITALACVEYRCSMLLIRIYLFIYLFYYFATQNTTKKTNIIKNVINR